MLTIDPNNVRRASASGTIRPVTWGAAVTAGQAVYEGDDQLWRPTDATDNTKPARTERLGFAMTSGPANGSGNIASGVGAVVEIGPDSGAAIGEVIILGGSAGGLQKAEELISGEHLTLKGYMQTATELALTPLVTGVLKP